MTSLHKYQVNADEQGMVAVLIVLARKYGITLGAVFQLNRTEDGIGFHQPNSRPWWLLVGPGIHSMPLIFILWKNDYYQNP